LKSNSVLSIKDPSHKLSRPKPLPMENDDRKSGLQTGPEAGSTPPMVATYLNKPYNNGGQINGKH
jgi:hypothetical protein